MIIFTKTLPINEFPIIFYIIASKTIVQLRSIASFAWIMTKFTFKSISSWFIVTIDTNAWVAGWLFIEIDTKITFYYFFSFIFYKTITLVASTVCTSTSRSNLTFCTIYASGDTSLALIRADVANIWILCFIYIFSFYCTVTTSCIVYSSVKISFLKFINFRLILNYFKFIVFKIRDPFKWAQLIFL